MSYANEELKTYYDALPERYGWDALCSMSIPKELERKCALDVACRRGKGVYKLSDAVGKSGRALGADWRTDMLDRAREGEAHALQKSGLASSNMAFVTCYPEQLVDAVGENCADFAYVNCVLNLFYDPAAALAQIRHVLKPGGLLVCDTVLSAGPRDPRTVAAARELGNAVQAAPHRKDLMAWLGQAGFDVTSIGAFAGQKVDPTWNADGKPAVPVAATNEEASFIATAVHIYAPDNIDRHGNSLMKDISQFR